MAREPMPISSLWFQGAMLTYLLGFTVLGLLAYLVYRDQPPMPAKVVAGDRILFQPGRYSRRHECLPALWVDGVWLRVRSWRLSRAGFYRRVSSQERRVSRRGSCRRAAGGLSARERVAAELHKNTYDPNEDSLLWSCAKSSGAQNDGGVLPLDFFCKTNTRRRTSRMDYESGRYSQTHRFLCLDCLDRGSQSSRDNPTRTPTIGRRSRWRVISLPPMPSPGA